MFPLKSRQSCKYSELTQFDSQVISWCYLCHLLPLCLPKTICVIFQIRVKNQGNGIRLLKCIVSCSIHTSPFECLRKHPSRMLRLWKQSASGKLCKQSRSDIHLSAAQQFGEPEVRADDYQPLRPIRNEFTLNLLNGDVTSNYRWALDSSAGSIVRAKNFSTELLITPHVRKTITSLKVLQSVIAARRTMKFQRGYAIHQLNIELVRLSSWRSPRD